MPQKIKAFVSQTPQKFYQRTKIPKLSLIIVALLAGGTGAYALIHSFAATSCTPTFGSFSSTTQPPGCFRFYGPESPFNTPVGPNPTLDPNSANIVNRTIGFNANPLPQLLNIADTSYDYSHPVYYSQTTDPIYTIHCTEPWGTCAVEGKQIRIPGAARPAFADDGHMAVIDQTAGMEYDFWQASKSKTSSGGTLDISWGGQSPVGNNSGTGLGGAATAADFDLAAGIIRPEEMEAGAVNHALFMTIPCTNGKSVQPSGGGAGRACSAIGLSNTDAPAMGQHYYIDMSESQINSLSVPAWKKVILHTLATYGAYLGDTGGNGWTFAVESGSSYTSFGQPDPWKTYAVEQGFTSNIDSSIGGRQVYHMDLGSAVNWASILRVEAPSGTSTPPPPSDTTDPTVSVTAPNQGATVSGQVPLAATASDNTAVTKVEFYADGNLISTDTSSPYTATWNATNATGGIHTITAKAYDAAGNVGTSSSITVTVIANPPVAPAFPKDGNVELTLKNPGTPYASTSFWNTLLPSNTPANPNNTTYINNILSDLSQGGAHPAALNNIRWSAPLYVVPANQPLVPVKPFCGSGPGFVNGVLAGGVPIPADAHAAAGTDEHISIYQPSTDKLWEFWRIQKDSDGNWEACFGGKMDNVSTSDGIFPYPFGGWTTGLPLLGSIVRIEELQAGQINHVIGLNLPNNLSKDVIPANMPGAANGISWPANRSDGTNTDPLAIPEGQRFRLPSNLDLNQYALSPVAKTIAVAAQKYGFVVTATGSNVALSLGDPTTYTAAGFADPYISLYGNNYNNPGAVMQNFPWDKLQALPFNYGQPGSSPTDTTSPTVSFSSPANGATVSGIVTATAAATDDTAVTKVDLSLDGNLKMTDTASPYNYSFDSKTLTNGNHTLTAKAYDAAGNTKSATITINVSNPDITPPNAPTGLTATAPSATTVNLTWNASTDTGTNQTGVTKYNVLRNGVVIAQPTTTSYTDTNRTANTAYSYTVQAIDGAGNTSNNSNTANVMTSGAVDSTPPTTPANLTASALAVGQVNLSWDISTDSGGSGLAGYNVYRDGTKLNTTPVTANSYGDNTVNANISYHYAVQAVDGAGNKSAQTSSVAVTTLKTITGDITGPYGVPDGSIDLPDISYVIRNYNTTNPGGDITGPNKKPDGIVDLFDLSYVIRNYGQKQ